jgi:hypothetical protein
LTDINYPVFRLGSEKPTTVNGVTFFLRQYTGPDGEHINKLLIVDDRNQTGATLAKRRLTIMQFENVKLKPLGKAVFFLGDLIKLATKNMWFIDSMGNMFQYKKTTSAKLMFRKIKKILNIPSGGSIIEVEGIPVRFKTLYSPKDYERYAGILVNGMSLIFYGVFDQPYSDTRRMI